MAAKMIKDKQNSGRQRGFTLIELVMVMVILSLVAAMGTQFIVTSSEMYRDTTERAKVITRGRQAIERISRQIQVALPNSIRVSASGRCIEFLPIVGASNYDGEVADASNGAPPTASVDTAPFDLDMGSAEYAAIGALSINELYVAAPDSIVSLGPIGSSGITSVNISPAHTFARNSVSKRIFIVDNPNRFCVNGGDELRFYSGYGLPTNAGAGLSDAEINAGTLMAERVELDGERPFSLSNATESRNALVQLEIPFRQGMNRVVLDHRILVRNVP